MRKPKGCFGRRKYSRQHCRVGATVKLSLEKTGGKTGLGGMLGKRKPNKVLSLDRYPETSSGLWSHCFSQIQVL